MSDDFVSTLRRVITFLGLGLLPIVALVGVMVVGIRSDSLAADFHHELYPQTRDVIASARVHRWELGNVYARPGRGRLQPALEGPLGPHQNLHLAGDYFAELGNIEAAARTGLTAAEQADARIREVTHV